MGILRTSNYARESNKRAINLTKLGIFESGTKDVTRPKQIHPRGSLILKQLMGLVLQGAEFGKCCYTLVYKVFSPQGMGRVRMPPCRAAQCL